MNTDTEKNINEAIDWLQQVGGSVQDFAVEQAPIYCREVVQWELWMGVSMCALAVALIPVVIFCWRTAKAWTVAETAKKKADCYYSTSDGFMGPLLAGIICAVGAVVLVSAGAPMAIKAAVAPRLVIVEHLRSLK